MNKLILLLCLISFNTQAVIYKLWWDDPIERESCIEFNGLGDCILYTPLLPEEIDHFNMYYTDAYGGEWFKTFDQWGDDNGRSYMAWWEPTEREFCVVMTTVDTGGRESLYSNEVCFTGPPDAPFMQCQ